MGGCCCYRWQGVHIGVVLTYSPHPLVRSHARDRMEHIRIIRSNRAPHRTPLSMCCTARCATAITRVSGACRYVESSTELKCGRSRVGVCGNALCVCLSVCWGGIPCAIGSSMRSVEQPDRRHVLWYVKPIQMFPKHLLSGINI